MKKILKVLFFISCSIIVVVFMPIKWVWRVIDWRYRIGGLVILFTFLIFETVTPAYWLALTQYYEARDESWVGQYAVANVVLNHKEHYLWPNTVSEVVHFGINRGRDNCDFSFMCDGKSENPWTQNHWGKWMMMKSEAWVILAIDRIGLRYDPTDGAMYYKRKDKKHPWFQKEQRAGRMKVINNNDLGAHHFFWYTGE